MFLRTIAPVFVVVVLSRPDFVMTHWTGSVINKTFSIKTKKQEQQLKQKDKTTYAIVDDFGMVQRRYRPPIRSTFNLVEEDSRRGVNN